MELERLPDTFTVCRVAKLDPLLLSEPFCFVGKTDEELSLVCRTASVPADALEREDGWRGFRIAGALDFSLVGILSAVTGILAEARIPVFAVSTFRTDYVFTKEERYEEALELLVSHGYTVR